MEHRISVGQPEAEEDRTRVLVLEAEDGTRVLVLEAEDRTRVLVLEAEDRKREENRKNTAVFA